MEEEVDKVSTQMLDDLKKRRVKTGQTKSVFVENRLNAILYQEM